MMRRILLFLMLQQAVASFAAPVKVEVDRNTVSANESFQITFSTSEDPGENPDETPLEQEFQILDRNHSNNSTWINGVANTSIEWTFTVMAKHAGKLTIPPLRFGNEVSPALAITVTENSNPPADVANNKAALFLEVDATPKQAYVQSQIIYTVRIYTRVKITGGNLEEPKIADAVVSKLAENKEYKTQINGRDYVVLERSYAIFPQKSGELIIPPLTLAVGVEEDDQSRFEALFGLKSARTEHLASKALTINVLPAPTSFKGHWLAAEQLELSQKWSAELENVKVGEPLTRTLILTAQGTTVGELPSLHQASSNDDLKSYPDQPRVEEQKSAQGIVAIREEKIAFIPSKAGTYTLPALELPWFNVKTQQKEIAKIPAVTIIAVGAEKATESNSAPTEIGDKPAVSYASKQNSRYSLLTDNYFWQGLAGFFALGWLLTVIFWVKRKSAFATTAKSLSPNAHPINDKDNITTLRKACANNNAKAAKQALLAWGKDKYNATTLGALAEFCDARLGNEIFNLNRFLYGQQDEEWEGKKLFKAFSENQEIEKTKRPSPDNEDKLEPLHRL